MKLTREQRLEAYTYALFMCLADEWPYLGVCSHLGFWIKHFSPSDADFPEFYKLKPDGLKNWQQWFRNQNDRIAAVCWAIEECEKSNV